MCVCVCVCACVYDEGCLPLCSPYCLVVCCTARQALVLCWKFALYKRFIIVIIISDNIIAAVWSYSLIHICCTKQMCFCFIFFSRCWFLWKRACMCVRFMGEILHADLFCEAMHIQNIFKINLNIRHTSQQHKKIQTQLKKCLYAFVCVFLLMLPPPEYRVMPLDIGF